MKKLFYIVSLCALIACNKIQENVHEYVSEGDRIPSFNVKMNDGQMVSDSDLSGSVSLICFFSTGCPDCQKAIPVVQEIFDDDICRIVMISRSEPESSVSKYWEDNNITLAYSAQEDDTVYKKFASGIIPRIYLVDPEGRIRFKHDDSPIPSAEQLRCEIIQLK